MRKMFGLLFVCLLFSATSLPAADKVQLMTAEELKENLNTENISILDARSEGGWSSSDVKIPGALRVTRDNFDELFNSLSKDNRLVLYCS